MREMRLTSVEFIVFVLIAAVVGSLSWSYVAEMQGRAQGVADAQRDLAAGVVGVKGFGKRMYWHRQYESILSERFEVQYEHVAACTPNQFDWAYIRAYNNAMSPAWRSKGVDLAAISTEARECAKVATP
jgi:hypothetical protein